MAVAVSQATVRTCPECGEQKPLRPYKNAVCTDCGSVESAPLGWPSKNDGAPIGYLVAEAIKTALLEGKDRGIPRRQTFSEGHEPTDATCPHCIQVRGSCCACDGRRLVPVDRLADLLSNVWARPSCICNACRRAGPMPSGVEDVTRAVIQPQRKVRAS